MKFSTDSRVAEQQMHAVIFYLTAFGYIDGDFDDSEKAFIRDYIGKLVEQRARDALGDDLEEHRDTIARWTTHFLEVFEMVDAEIQGHFTESVADGEDTKQFVLAKIKLRCFELFKQFDEENRAALLGTVDVLMMADGVVHPSEQQFRDELLALLSAPIELDDLEIETVEEGSVVIAPATKLGLREIDHPFFKRGEVDYAKDPVTFAKQAELESRARPQVRERPRGAACPRSRQARRSEELRLFRREGAVPRRARVRRPAEAGPGVRAPGPR